MQVSGCIKHGGGVGTVLAGTCVSDKSKKKNIRPLDDQLGHVLSLNPVRYDYKNPAMGNNDEIGLIAQEVANVLPEMIDIGDDGVMKIRYDVSMQIRLLKAIQEQQELIEAQQTEIAALKSQMKTIERSIQSSKGQSSED